MLRLIDGPFLKRDGTLSAPVSPRGEENQNRMQVRASRTDGNEERMKVRPTLTEENLDGSKTTLVGSGGNTSVFERYRAATQPNLKPQIETSFANEKKEVVTPLENAQPEPQMLKQKIEIQPAVDKQPEKIIENEAQKQESEETIENIEELELSYDNEPIVFSKTPILSMFTPRFLIRSLFHTVMSLQYAFMRG